MYYRDPYLSLGDLFGGLFVAALIIEIWLIVKITLLIIRAFIRHPKSILLWSFLATIVISLVVIVCLVISNQGQPVDDPVQRVVAGVFSALAILGFLGLVITALVFHLKDSDTLMAEKPGLVDQILHMSWISDDTPLEYEHEQVAT